MSITLECNLLVNADSVLGLCAQLEEVCKNVPFEAKLHHAILKPPPQTTEESQYRCTVCSRPLKSILGTKAHMQTGASRRFTLLVALAFDLRACYLGASGEA